MSIFFARVDRSSLLHSGHVRSEQNAEEAQSAGEEHPRFRCHNSGTVENHEEFGRGATPREVRRSDDVSRDQVCCVGGR